MFIYKVAITCLVFKAFSSSSPTSATLLGSLLSALQQHASAIMFTKSLKAALALVASSALLSTPVLAALGRTTLFKDGLSPHVDASFWSNLTPTQSTWDQWGWGWIPQRCFDEANSNGLSPYDIEVFNGM